MSVPVIYFDLGNTLVFGPTGNKQPFPDAVTTIEELWLRGYRIGLLSNQSVGTTIDNVQQKLDDYGLESFRFDVITISSEFNPPIPKPDPEIFEAALAKSGHVAASNDTVFVTEDLPHVEAARNLGWRAIHKPYPGNCTSASGECVEDLDDLLALFPPLSIDLFIRDASDDLGENLYPGSTFWNSPDLWVRNSNDGGTDHQSPEAAEDNWFYCRVHNRGVGIARQFFVLFKIQEWAGTQFVYSGDYVPATAVAGGRGIDPGNYMVVNQIWNAEDVPPAGTHACWLASAWIPSDQPIMGAHPWEHNNLAQKNLVIVDAEPGETGEIPVVLGNRLVLKDRYQRLELHRTAKVNDLQIHMIGQSAGVMGKLVHAARTQQNTLPPVTKKIEEVCMRFLDPSRIEITCSGSQEGAFTLDLESGSFLTLRDSVLPAQQKIFKKIPTGKPARLKKDDRGHGMISFDQNQISAIGLGFCAGQIVRTNLRFTVPKTAKPGDQFDLDLVQRNAEGFIEGGISFQINVKKKKGGKKKKSTKS